MRGKTGQRGRQVSQQMARTAGRAAGRGGTAWICTWQTRQRLNSSDSSSSDPCLTISRHRPLSAQEHRLLPRWVRFISILVLVFYFPAPYRPRISTDIRKTPCYCHICFMSVVPLAPHECLEALARHFLILSIHTLNLPRSPALLRCNMIVYSSSHQLPTSRNQLRLRKAFRAAFSIAGRLARVAACLILNPWQSRIFPLCRSFRTSEVRDRLYMTNPGETYMFVRVSHSSWRRGNLFIYFGTLV